jgi:hypothetical protein
LRYRVNEPAVAAELHDGDAILINFDNGRYYDTSGAGGEIVRLILKGHSVDEIASAVARLSSLGESEIAGVLDRFVSALAAEGLIVQVAARPESALAAPLDVELPHGFVEPVLHRHVELEDLLQLDPIHDADDAGWPIPKSKNGTPETPDEG